MSKQIEADITIVGGGIAGLWAAKELVDNNYSVTLLESNKALAAGATTRNEGWLHAGTYHSVALENEAEIIPVTENTIASHRAIVAFAPESIDHTTTYALATSENMAHKAVERWKQTGVTYSEVSKSKFAHDKYLATARLKGIFAVEDKSINSRMLCQKLAHYIIERGGKILTGANFIPEDETKATLHLNRGSHYIITSSRFLIAAGGGTQKVLEGITGQQSTTRYFKAHLLVTPRLTKDNYFHLEAGEAGLMNHGKTSIVGINRDGIEQSIPDASVVNAKSKLIHSALNRMLPGAEKRMRSIEKVMAIACLKPDITGSFGEIQSLDVKIFKPSPNYLCILPGKMTLAPYLGKKVLEVLLNEGMTASGNSRKLTSMQNIPDVSLRPVDLLNNTLDD